MMVSHKVTVFEDGVGIEDGKLLAVDTGLHVGLALFDAHGHLLGVRGVYTDRDPEPLVDAVTEFALSVDRIVVENVTTTGWNGRRVLDHLMPYFYQTQAEVSLQLPSCKATFVPRAKELTRCWNLGPHRPHINDAVAHGLYWSWKHV